MLKTVRTFIELVIRLIAGVREINREPLVDIIMFVHAKVGKRFIKIIFYCGNYPFHPSLTASLSKEATQCQVARLPTGILASRDPMTPYLAGYVCDLISALQTVSESLAIWNVRTHSFR